MAWKHFRSIPLLAEGSNITDNLGVIPRVATRELWFKNQETDMLFKTTDLELKKHKRNQKINKFIETYTRLNTNKSVSILLICQPLECTIQPSSFLRNLKEKLGRVGVEILGYIWLRDIGEIKFERHYHYMVATTRIKGSEFKKIVERKKKEYNIILCNSPIAFKKYLVKKEIYAPNKKRSYGSSQSFEKC